MDFFTILTLIGGLSLFLYGMNEMGDGLKKLSGGRLESILSRLTSNRLMAFFLSFAVIAITTVQILQYVFSRLRTILSRHTNIFTMSRKQVQTNSLNFMICTNSVTVYNVFTNTHQPTADVCI